MSIGSIVQTIHSPSAYAYQPATTSTAAPSDPFALASSAGSKSSSNGAAATGGNTMQSLTSDIQSALLSLQSIDGSGAPATAQLASATSTAASPAATASNPFQSLSSDLQSALLNLQSDGSGSASAQQTGGATHVHRGHHHHGGGNLGMDTDPTGGVQADAPSLPGATQSKPTTT